MQWNVDFSSNIGDLTESLLVTDGVGSTFTAYSMPLMMGTLFTFNITSVNPTFISVMTTTASVELHHAVISCLSPNQSPASVTIQIAGMVHVYINDNCNNVCVYVNVVVP